MRWIRILFFLWLASLPFGTRIFLGQFTSGFHEYEAMFLYASDILLITFLILFSINHSYILKNVRMSFIGPALVVFLLFAAFSIAFAYSQELAVYNFIRLILLVLVALAIGQLVRGGVVKIRTIFTVIAASAVFQSLIGIFQFLKQSNLGLGFLGESTLGPNIGGAAKIIVEGVPILRAYGTFPHPNVLGAFLILGLMSLYYLWMKSTNNESITNGRIFVNSNFIRDSLMGFCFFIIFFGLLLTFSRTAWFITAIIILTIIGYSLLAKTYRRRAVLLLIILVAIGYILVAIFRPYILPRARVSTSEPAVVQRLEYNKLGLEISKKFPRGIGIGNQVLSSVKNGFYEQLGMDKVWQWQPIHNIYLLMASEIGVLGLAAFLVFLFPLFLNPNFKNLGFPKVMLISLLVFGFFDHFLWTLQPGRLMLWLVIGILLASAHSTMDSARPSEG